MLYMKCEGSVTFDLAQDARIRGCAVTDVENIEAGRTLHHHPVLQDPLDVESISDEQIRASQEMLQKLLLARAAARRVRALCDDATNAVNARASDLAAAERSANDAQQRLKQLQLAAADVDSYNEWTQSFSAPPVCEALDCDFEGIAEEALNLMNTKVCGPSSPMLPALLLPSS